MTNKPNPNNCLHCGKQVTKDFLFCDKVCHERYKTKKWNRSYLPKGTTLGTYKKP